MNINPRYNFLKPYKVKKLERLGRKFDGGYVVCSEVLKKCENLITLGVGDDISFEIDFEKKKNSKLIQLYDYTVNNYSFLKIILKYFRRLITFRASLKTFNYSIQNFINFLNFLKKDNVIFQKLKIVKRETRHNHINLKNIFKNINDNKNLLKIDIEGSEYEIIDDIVKINTKIKMLIIEFHWINKNRNLFSDSVNKLKFFFDIIHVHANNYRPMNSSDDIYDVIEITLVNKKINKYRKEYRYNFPIKNLDYECFPNHKKIAFKFKN